MSAAEHPPIQDAIRSALRQAMTSRDRRAMSAYRNALARLDNATAVPLTDEHRAGAVENSRVGVGSSDEARRELTERERRDLVQEEITSLIADADRLDAARPGAGTEPREQALVLSALLAR